MSPDDRKLQAPDEVQRALSPEELEAQEAAELPTREALTLISTDPTTMPLYNTADGSGMLGGTPSDSTGATDTASGTANDAADMASTDADASGTEPGTASVTEGDRSEQISQSDTAVAGPS